jgi:hypothetical protein
MPRYRRKAFLIARVTLMVVLKTGLRPVASPTSYRSTHCFMGTSNNCHQSSGAPNLPTNDSALFSFRFRAVHPKDVRDCQLRQLFEVPLYNLRPDYDFISGLGGRGS